jgi:S-adenosylmethionine hydrolase
MRVLSLMTDFGLKDGNVGVMKGVIWSIAPEARISDLTHMIQPQSIAEAAFILARSVHYFPAGTVHVAVVDPGVGTARRPMAARLGEAFFVGPDNGLLTTWLEQARREGQVLQFVHLDRPEYWLPEISRVFHGRDVFAPVAAHLARGVPLENLGTSFDDPVLLKLPEPVRTANGWRGQVIHVDHFGNAASNIRAENLGPMLMHKERIAVKLTSARIDGMVDTFGERPVGESVALLGSTGNLIVAVVNGNAADRLGIRVGDPIEASDE